MNNKWSIFLFTALFLLGVSIMPAMAGMGGGPGGGGMGSGDAGMGNPPGEMEPGGNDRTPAGMNRDEEVSLQSMGSVSAGSMVDGGVKMELEPASFKDGIFRVKFYANTHTGDLGRYDLRELMHLEYEDVGYRPVLVDRMRGHHAGGEIAFRVPEVPEHFRIVVRGVPNLEQRVFEW